MIVHIDQRVASEADLKIKRVGGCRGEGAAPPPAMRTKKEAHRHKWRWISIKIK